jgi:BirA family biotin operon repressor/biotin-[acetyl-CoA-carboxylase] ligase
VFAKVKPNTRIIGQNIIYFNQVASTNSYALELLRQKIAENGTVIVTEYQTDGRGQTGKNWQSEPFKNLLFSVILKPVTKHSLNPFSINKAIAIAMHETIQNLLPNQNVHIKWPNDILVNRQKICGILTENNFTGQSLNACIIGIGLNVNQIFEKNNELNSSSLKMFLDIELDRASIFKHVLEALEIQIDKLIDANESGIQTQYNRLLLGYKQIQTFVLNSQSITAKLQACDSNGSLVIQLGDGSEESYMHGTIKQIIHD